MQTRTAARIATGVAALLVYMYGPANIAHAAPREQWCNIDSDAERYEDGKNFPHKRLRRVRFFVDVDAGTVSFGPDGNAEDSGWKINTVFPDGSWWGDKPRVVGSIFVNMDTGKLESDMDKIDESTGKSVHIAMRGSGCHFQ